MNETFTATITGEYANNDAYDYHKYIKKYDIDEFIGFLPDRTSRHKILELAYQQRSSIGHFVETYIMKMRSNAAQKLINDEAHKIKNKFTTIETDNKCKKAFTKILIEQIPRNYISIILQTVTEVIDKLYKNDATKIEFKKELNQINIDNSSPYFILQLNTKINNTFNSHEIDKIYRLIEIKCCRQILERDMSQSQNPDVRRQILLIRFNIEYDIVMNCKDEINDIDLYDIINEKKEKNPYVQNINKQNKDAEKQCLKRKRDEFIGQIKNIKESLDKAEKIKKEKEEEKEKEKEKEKENEYISNVNSLF